MKVEETVTAPVGEGVPAVAEGSAVDTPVTSDVGTTVEGGEGTTPESTEESFTTKFDPKTFTPEGLKIYKKLQGDYTRARQADKLRTQQLEEQIKSVQPLLAHKDVQATAYYLQYGKFPEGYQPMFAQAQPKQEEPQINPEEIQDPVVKQLYLDNLKMKQDYEARSKQDNEKMVENTNNGVKSFYEKLSPERKTLWQENIKDIQESATLYASKGMPVELALKKAFNSACADKLFELGKLEAMNTMRKKVETKRPESGVNIAADSLVDGNSKTPEDAVMSAIASIRSK